MKTPREHYCALAVIGAGTAGMAAAVFAADRNIDTVQVGDTGELTFASGMLDLMGVHPMESGYSRDNPWEAVKELVHDRPRHPYARLNPAEMRRALTEYMDFLKACDLPYYHEPERNLRVITPVGTIKTTHAVPETVRHGVQMLKDKAPCLIVDFHGLKGFSGTQIAETLIDHLPDLRTRRISFPDTSGEVIPEHLALKLESADTRKQLAERIKPHIHDAQYIGIPAVLGLYRTMTVYKDLQDLLGKPLFEIPTMPPSISGQRLREVFEHRLPSKGIRAFYHSRVLIAEHTDNKGFKLEVGTKHPETTVYAKGVILATGRFFGKGLHATRKEVRETVFDLPMYQITDRNAWHRKSFFNPKGHCVNTAGLEIDDMMRPVDHTRTPVFPTLFAAGSILAHQDWKRMKCGSGLSITTAYRAVSSFAALSKQSVK